MEVIDLFLRYGFAPLAAWNFFLHNQLAKCVKRSEYDKLLDRVISLPTKDDIKEIKDDVKKIYDLVYDSLLNCNGSKKK